MLPNTPTRPAPKPCLRSLRISAPCATCGERREPVHMPLHLVGLFCERCCPVCRPSNDLLRPWRAGSPIA